MAATLDNQSKGMGEKESEEGLIKIRKTLNTVLRSFGFFSWELVFGGIVEGPAASPEFVRDAESWPHGPQNLLYEAQQSGFALAVPSHSFEKHYTRQTTVPGNTNQ